MNAESRDDVAKRPGRAGSLAHHSHHQRQAFPSPEAGGGGGGGVAGNRKSAVSDVNGNGEAQHLNGAGVGIRELVRLGEEELR